MCRRLNATALLLVGFAMLAGVIATGCVQEPVEDKQPPDLSIIEMEIPAFPDPNHVISVHRGAANPFFEVNVIIRNVAVRDLAGDDPVLLAEMTARGNRRGDRNVYGVRLVLRDAEGRIIDTGWGPLTDDLAPEEQQTYEFDAWVPPIADDGAYDLCAVVFGIEEVTYDNNEVCRPLEYSTPEE